jgi:hypothetical protein
VVWVVRVARARAGVAAVETSITGAEAATWRCDEQEMWSTSAQSDRCGISTYDAPLGEMSGSWPGLSTSRTSSL